MPLIGKRRQSFVTIALTVVLAISLAAWGLWWIAKRRFSNALSPGVDAYARGDWTTAANVARERLKIARDDFAAVRLLARASVQLGRDSSALSLFEQLEPASMTADDFHLLGIALFRTDNRAGAVTVWQQALRSNPDHPETLYKLIQVYLATDRFHDAALAAHRLAKHPDWEAQANRLLGKIQFARNDPSGAAEFWQRALDHPSAALANTLERLTARKDLSRALLQARRSAEAKGQLQAILAQTPDVEASWLLSRAHLQEGALPEALAALKEADSFADENPTLPDPAPFVGAASCAKCHLETFQAQRSSRHARTFHRTSELQNVVLPRPSFPDPVDAKVSHTLRKVGDHLEQETHTPERVFKAVVDYAFGSGDRGKTLVGHDASGLMVELRLSVYHEGVHSVWDVTSGHAPHPPVTLGFLGMPQTDDAVRRCLSCHVTSPEAVLTARGPEAADCAIGCEKCHGPGGNHLIAVAAKFPDLAIARPSLASGERVVKICAQCHSPRGKTVEPDDPASVRFQATTLTWSRCYIESEDRLDCVTCHDPHRNVMTSEAHYEAKCLVCHPGQSLESGRTRGRLRRRIDLTDAPYALSCPVNPATGCISCHMPKVKDAIPHSPFTDHFIRVHRE